MDHFRVHQQQGSILWSLSSGTAPCEDLIVSAEPLGDRIPEANRPPYVLDWTRGVPVFLNRINCAYPIIVHNLMLVETAHYLAALESSTAYCFKETVTCLPSYSQAPTLAGLNLLIRCEVLYNHPQGYPSQECIHPPTLKGLYIGYTQVHCWLLSYCWVLR